MNLHMPELCTDSHLPQIDVVRLIYLQTLSQSVLAARVVSMFCTHLRQQIFTDAVHNLFPGQAASTTSTLGLSVHDNLDGCLDLQSSEGQISIGVQSKDLRAFLTWQLLNGLQICECNVKQRV